MRLFADVHAYVHACVLECWRVSVLACLCAGVIAWMRGCVHAITRANMLVRLGACVHVCPHSPPHPVHCYSLCLYDSFLMSII